MALIIPGPPPPAVALLQEAAGRRRYDLHGVTARGALWLKWPVVAGEGAAEGPRV